MQPPPERGSPTTDNALALTSITNLSGTAQDCDDGDPAIFPGAPEIKHDGNGYDLTIEINSAIFRPDIDEFEVIATSALAEQASLVLEGFGPMAWIAALNHWETIVSGVFENTATLTVSGIEGVDSAATLACMNTCLGDFSDGAVACQIRNELHYPAV